MKWMMCVDYIRSDYYRIKGDKEASLAKMLLYTSVDIGFRFMFWFRLAKWDSVFNIVPRIIYRHLSLKHKIDCVGRSRPPRRRERARPYGGVQG